MENSRAKTFRYDPALLAAERRRRNVTQAQIADRIGYSRQQVNLAEKGRSASFVLIQRLCKELSIPISSVVPDVSAA